MRRLAIALWFLQISVAQTTYVVKTVCASGCDFSSLQTAMNTAATYQTSTACVPYILRLKAGEVFEQGGDFNIPAKTCAYPVYVDGSELARFPQGTRIDGPTAQAAGLLPRIRKTAGGSATISTTLNQPTRGWYFRGVEITLHPSFEAVYSLIQIGQAETSRALLSSDIHFERSYIHGINDLPAGPRNCILYQADWLYAADNWIDNCGTLNTTGIGGESKCFTIINGRGGIIQNNFCRAYSIGSLIGGSSTAIPGLVHTDYVFQGNYYSRRTTWWNRHGSVLPSGSCTFEGQYYRNDAAPTNSRVCTGGVWTATTEDRPSQDVGPKNSWELKNACRVMAEGNYFELAWPDENNLNQRGSLTLFNQVDGDESSTFAYWATICDATFRYNRAKYHTAFVVFGRIGTKYFNLPRGIKIHDNLVTNQMSRALGLSNDGGYLEGSPYSALFTSGLENVSIAHNTVAPDANPIPTAGSISGFSVATSATAPNYMGFVVHSNILPYWTLGLLSGDEGNRGLCVGYKANVRNGGAFAFESNLWMNPHNISLQIDTTTVPSQECNTADRFRAPSSLKTPSAYIGYVNLSDVFTNAGSDDYSTIAGVQSATTGVDGAPLAADLTAVNAATANAIAGTPNPFFNFVIRNKTPISGGAVIDIVKPTPSASCTVTTSTSRAFSSDLGTDSPVTTDQRLVVTITGLTAKTRHYARIDCGGYRRETEFITQ